MTLILSQSLRCEKKAERWYDYVRPVGNNILLSRAEMASSSSKWLNIATKKKAGEACMRKKKDLSFKSSHGRLLDACRYVFDDLLSRFVCFKLDGFDPEKLEH